MFEFTIFISLINVCLFANVISNNLDYSNKINWLMLLPEKTLNGSQNWHIVPGTKWCGSQNRAIDKNDLGVFWATDSCCREHDQCSCIIPRMSTKYGLTNDKFYSKIHCDCEVMFANCLQRVTNDILAPIVGGLYFNLVNTKCFSADIKKHQDRPICPKNKRYDWYDTPSWSTDVSMSVFKNILWYWRQYGGVV